MSYTACQQCTAPVADNAALCVECTNTIVNDLDTIVDLYGYLTDTVTKQTRHSRGRIGSRSTNTPVPFDQTASDVDAAVTNTIRTLTETCIDQTGADFHIRMTPQTGLTCAQQARLAFRFGDPIGYTHAPGEHGHCGHATCKAIEDRSIQPLTVQRAWWLGGQTEWIRHNEHATDIAHAIHTAAEMLTRTVDRPEDRRFLGPCGQPGVHLASCECESDDCQQVGECEATVYAKADALFARCWYCGTKHDVKARTRDNLERARDRLGTATEIERWTGGLDKPIKADRIRQWKLRGKIASHGRNEKGDPMYLIGEVLDKATDERVAEQVKKRNTA